MQPASSGATGSASTSSSSSTTTTSATAFLLGAGSSSAAAGGLGSTRPSGLGLARYRSAPATWLEALLEEDEGEVGGDDDPLELLRPNETLTQLLSSPVPTLPTRNLSGLNGYVASSSDHHLHPGSLLLTTPSSGPVLFRQNSSPAEFLGSSSFDGLYSSYDLVSGGNYDYVSSSSPTGSKRTRDIDSQLPTTPKFSTQVKKEPSSSSQMTGGMGGLLDLEMDKLLEDSVPCRVRAKRGCATHPRSIAERVRRTRISDRIRKLQELVPNMDKQTNTADMLEEAVEYVKFLQNQIKELTERQSRCKCIVRE